MKRCLLILIAAGIASNVVAHDPYEISSVAYVYSNRIELFVECEFATGMRLAGIEPFPNQAEASQFESHQAELRNFAGSFFTFTAGNNAVLPRQTNVTLEVENHIRTHLEFAPTPYRPLQFSASGLRNISESPYGTTLTVLDMVNQKVLGQTTLFAESAPAEFPPREPQSDPAPIPPVMETNIAATRPAAEIDPPATTETPPPESDKTITPQEGLSWLVVVLGIATFALVINAVLRKPTPPKS